MTDKPRDILIATVNDLHGDPIVVSIFSESVFVESALITLGFEFNAEGLDKLIAALTEARVKAFGKSEPLNKGPWASIAEADF